MNPAEISWRITQKLSSSSERFRFSSHTPVTKTRFWDTGSNSHFNCRGLAINFDNTKTLRNTEIKLLGPYKYEDYVCNWHAGFNTNAQWPLTPSSNLRYKQRDDIGDARLNWELNRHHQLALLAKEYFISRDNEALHAFRDIFYDWNEKNPFLYGISWTSVMEVAIRAISQMYALAFLSAAQISDKQLIDQLETSIINCVNHISRHYSRYSSANNHLLVEMTAIGLAGYAFDIPKWRKLAIDTLTEQLPLQTYPDGVNREVSLHYHSFAMEAYLLLANAMLAAGDELPPLWIPMLDKMSTFLASSMVDDKTAIEFGDSDEGKIIDLEGGIDYNHYAYVLQFASLITGKKYHSFSTVSENIYWLFPERAINHLVYQPVTEVAQSKTFPDGGYSFLRSRDNRTVVAIDHAALGFGAIAAHGHDDALSFQLYRDGKPIFGDPGTGIYHCNLPLRNLLRDARHHSTVTINGMDSAEMRGAFLWGRKPITTLYISELTPDVDTIIADTTGLSGIKHRRKFTFDKISSTLIIDDEFEQECDWLETFVIAPGVDVNVNGNRAELSQGFILTSKSRALSVHDGEYSQSYGCLNWCNLLTVIGHGNSNTIIIEPQ